MNDFHFQEFAINPVKRAAGDACVAVHGDIAIVAGISCSIGRVIGLRNAQACGIHTYMLDNPMADQAEAPVGSGGVYGFQHEEMRHDAEQLTAGHVRTLRKDAAGLMRLVVTQKGLTAVACCGVADDQLRADLLPAFDNTFGLMGCWYIACQ